jgi:DNA primase small subunit
VNQSAAALKQFYKAYYFNHIEQLEAPTRITEREFGYMTFDYNMVRHLTLKTSGDLRSLVLKEAPNSVYYSTSFYIDPSLPMHEKGWLGGELVFDIDADTLDSPCRLEHDKWICRECGMQERGIRPPRCPRCKGRRLHEINIACKVCLGAAKTEALKLLDILTEDFGLSRRKIDVFFSGNMGYHISVQNTVFESADQMTRSEIVDYVSGQAFILESLGISPKSGHEELLYKLPSESDGGWRGRVARHFKAVAESEGKSEDVRVTMTNLYRHIGYRKFRLAVQDVAKKSGATVDPSVTTDIHRIFRMPGTLHGKTGLLKKRCGNLESFNPLVDAVAFGREPLKVTIEYSPRFMIGGDEFGPFKSQSLELPRMAAVYLLGLGMAKLGD